MKRSIWTSVKRNRKLLSLPNSTLTDVGRRVAAKQQRLMSIYIGIPAIIDHDNDDFVLWESFAIIKYLVDRYDKENTIHFATGSKESYLVDQWLAFQVSGQVRLLLAFFQFGSRI